MRRYYEVDGEKIYVLFEGPYAYISTVSYDEYGNEKTAFEEKASIAFVACTNVHLDKDCSTFKYKDKTICVDDYICKTLDELINDIDNGTNIHPDDFTCTLKRYQKSIGILVKPYDLEFTIRKQGLNIKVLDDWLMYFDFQVSALGLTNLRVRFKPRSYFVHKTMGHISTSIDTFIAGIYNCDYKLVNLDTYGKE